jgi:hypothetical protein
MDLAKPTISVLSETETRAIEVQAALLLGKYVRYAFGFADLPGSGNTSKPDAAFSYESIGTAFSHSIRWFK